MSSSKALLCNICVMLAVVLAQDNPISPNNEDVPKGNCTCGGFPSIVIDAESQPLLSQSPGLEVKCDNEGESTCKQLCIALATAAKAKGPDVLCMRLQNAEELKLSAFSKICDRPWMYADMTADDPLCCGDSKVKSCASSDMANATEILM